jgi:hypothetical protein
VSERVRLEAAQCEGLKMGVVKERRTEGEEGALVSSAPGPVSGWALGQKSGSGRADRMARLAQ